MKKMALGKEVNEGLDAVNTVISRQLRSEESGLPTIASFGFLPLNMDEFTADEIPSELLGGDR